MNILLSFIIILIISIFAFLQHPKFGKNPSGVRLEKIKNSPHYKNGAFHNLNYTTVMVEGVNILKVIKEFMFVKNKPYGEIPSKKTNLLNLDKTNDILVWFGHSSYFIQIDGKKVLVDPVLSGSASPLSFTNKAFKGSDVYSADDIPEIDYLFITHNHWDHLDYKTLLLLKPKIKKIICSFGLGETMEYWGFDPTIIFERDWNEKIILDSGFTAYTVPARHFSGRSFIRNKSFWTAFVFQTPSLKIFIGGDGGYDTHFAETGKKFGEFDLVILENGQYNDYWKYIHMKPEEVIQAAIDLNAKRLFPVHSSKFALALHAWDEPLIRITALNIQANLTIITPMIGEQVNLKDSSQKFNQWWKDIKCK
jgi:L-ascorbate metabolism protein UlaG (beta-lactamase superfamily)